jgi:SecD/SecF fusion protein
VPVEVVEQRVVGPTLGAEAIDASLRAAVIGLLCTGVFIAFVYRLMGLLATVALACYALISFAVLVWLGAHADAAGPRRLRARVGMAIDANVLGVRTRAGGVRRERRTCRPRCAPASPRRGARSSTPT